MARTRKRVMLAELLPVTTEAFVAIPPGHRGSAVDLVALCPSTRQAFAAGNAHWAFGRAQAQDSFGWGQPVLAPITGEVVVAVDGTRDREQLHAVRDVLDAFLLRPLRHRKNPLSLAGNYIVVASSNACTLLAHLRSGSVRVRVGEWIRAGDPIGEIGNSGNAVVPHVHWQMMDTPDPLSARILPIQVPHERWVKGRGWVVDDGSIFGERWGRVRARRSLSIPTSGGR